jgi:hypothetical protein
LGAEKSWEGYRGGFLRGVMQILVCFVVVNRGEVVVNCVVDRGELHGVFRGRKTCHFLCEFLKILVSRFVQLALNSMTFGFYGKEVIRVSAMRFSADAIEFSS